MHFFFLVLCTAAASLEKIVHYKDDSLCLACQSRELSIFLPICLGFRKTNYDLISGVEIADRWPSVSILDLFS